MFLGERKRLGVMLTDQSGFQVGVVKVEEKLSGRNMSQSKNWNVSNYG
jgi:hypothetical protein